MAWDSLTGDGVRHWASEAESRRFGISIGRVVVGYDAEPGEALERRLVEVLDEAPEELLIVRYPSAASRLGAAAGRSAKQVIPADVLTYWEVPADELARVPGDADPALAVAPGEVTDAARAALETVLVDSFRGYGNHYTANPALDPDLALAGYLEWAMGAFEKDPHNAILLTHDGVPVGASTLTEGDGHLEIELAGMTGASQGQGWYRVLLAGIGEEAIRRGLPRVIISTQVSNVRVQRAWVRAGMKPFAAVTTLHVAR